MNPITLDAAVVQAIELRGISRLVHFTASRNLPRLIVDAHLRSAKDLATENVVLHAETDPWRSDGHPDKISCSIEYPNVHYLRQVKARNANFPDWVYLMLKPRVAAIAGALFAPANAARNDVTLLPGQSGFFKCYSGSVATGARTIPRAPSHNFASPTDMQSEVLVPAPVPLSAVLSIVVPSSSAGTHERDRLKFLHHDPDIFNWIVAPGLFDIDSVRAAVRNGRRISESAWKESS